MSDKDSKQAIALKYSPEKHAAPLVTAKGTGKTAEAIIAKAFENGVPIQEDKSLAQLLSAVDLGTPIPPELYQVVAEILALVYKMEQQAKKW